MPTAIPKVGDDEEHDEEDAEADSTAPSAAEPDQEDKDTGHDADNDDQDRKQPVQDVKPAEADDEAEKETQPPPDEPLRSPDSGKSTKAAVRRELIKAAQRTVQRPGGKTAAASKAQPKKVGQYLLLSVYSSVYSSV